MVIDNTEGAAFLQGTENQYKEGIISYSGGGTS